jgi:drug/metabolite transporter (DMT)-like permease
MLKQFCRAFSPTFLLVLGAIMLWGSLYSSIINTDESEKPSVGFFVVLYVAYFTMFIMVLQAFSALLPVLAPRKQWVKMMSVLMHLPAILFAVFVGIISLALAHDVSLLALVPAVVYFSAAFLFVWQDFKLFRSRNA